MPPKSWPGKLSQLWGACLDVFKCDLPENTSMPRNGVAGIQGSLQQLKMTLLQCQTFWAPDPTNGLSSPSLSFSTCLDSNIK